MADVGCGHGASAVVMAQAYPGSRVWGFDYHAPSIETARKRADRGGRRRPHDVRGRQTPRAIRAGYDLICFFDCLHDMGDPVGIARYAREHLEADGTVLLVEPFALDDKAANLTTNPMAALLLHRVIGDLHPELARPKTSAWAWAPRPARPGSARCSKQAGYSRFRRAAETPMNLILEARP